MILITGGTGLLGSHLIFHLASMEEKVRVLIRNQASKNRVTSLLENIYGILPEHFNKLDFVVGDINNCFTLKEAFKDIKYVFHCAAKVSFGTDSQKEMMDTNIRGTANIVNACLQYKTEKLVHVSSIAAIDSSSTKTGMIVESSGWPTSKNLDYAYSKTESELEVWRGISEGLNAVVVNPSVIIGEGDFNTGSGLLFNRVYKGLKYYTHGITGFVDVKDVVRIMIKLLKSNISGARFIINAENLTYKDFFIKVAEALKVQSPTHYASHFKTEIAWRFEKISSLILMKQPALTKKAARTSHEIAKYSSQKITESLGFTFTPINDTISRVADFYLKNLNF
jgi:nucleoside-diphosphate-sugar epimerase